MAITQTRTFPLSFKADGVSTSMSFNLFGYIKLQGVLPETPLAVTILSSSISAAFVSYSISGSTVTLNYATPIDGNWITLQVEF